MSNDTNSIRFDRPQGVAVEEQAPTNGAAPAAPAPAAQVAQQVNAAMAAQQAPAVPETPAAPAAPQQTTHVHPEVEVAVGRGLDVGTANLLGCAQNGAGEIVVGRERNAFLAIPAEFVGNREMLTKLNVPYVSYKERLFVLGDAAFNLANMFGQEVRRPMQHGFLSPAEQDAIPMMRFIIHRLLGDPKTAGEKVCFCIPAPSIDKDNDTVYHEGIVSGILRKLGYTPQSMNEGHAVVYSSLAENDFTGIGVSCGGGMFNVCVAYKTIPAVKFSVARGGDWIDSTSPA